MRFTLVQQRIERTIEQGVDQAGRGVIAAGRFPFVPSGRGQPEIACGQLDLRVQFEQAFIDASQLFAPQIFKIDPAQFPHFLVFDRAQGADCAEQTAIAQFPFTQKRHRFPPKQQRTQHRQPQRRPPTALPTQQGHDQAHPFI